MSKGKYRPEKNKEIDLEQTMKGDSSIFTIALQDGLPNRTNYIELFDTLTRFLTSYTVAIAGIDKETYKKIQIERLEKAERLNAEIKKKASEPVEDAIVEEVITETPQEENNGNQSI